ncbi:hypothetical protein SISSUDRAFT_958982, partial [Sistotremastrum suecicum HHB10207 ss-3]
DIMDFAEEVVLRRLKDFVARRDYALYDSGAASIPAWTSPTFNFRSISHSKSNGPDEALRSNTQVGHCWPTPGSSGRLGIRLSDAVIISHITIDHLPIELAPDISTAPRKYSLWGYHPANVDGALIHLSEGEYDIRSTSHIQTFPVFEAITRLNLSYIAVLLDIQSNWGSLDHTCLYRVRIHG